MHIDTQSKTATAIFQTNIENLLRDIPNVLINQDDITVGEKNWNNMLNHQKQF